MEVLRFYDTYDKVVESRRFTSAELANDAYDKAVADLNHGNCGDAVKVVYGTHQHAVPTPQGTVDRVEAEAEDAKGRAAEARAKRAVERDEDEAEQVSAKANKDDAEKDAAKVNELRAAKLPDPPTFSEKKKVGGALTSQSFDAFQPKDDKK